MSTASLPDETPRQKKQRTKYATKACYECQRQKIKCSDERPCPRCLHKGVECHSGEDQSPPARRDEPVDRQTAEARLIELRFQALERKYDQLRAIVEDRTTANGVSRQSEDYVDHDGPGYQGDSALLPTIAHLEASLQLPQSRPQVTRSGFSTPRLLHREQRTDPRHREDGFEAAHILGSSDLPFPSPAEYQNYIHFFFEDINRGHPAINEPGFRKQAQGLVLDSRIAGRDVCFLALNYIIFACADFLRASDAEHPSRRFPGWDWFLAAHRLVGKRKATGHGGMPLVQYLVYEAFYLMHAGRSNAAYHSVGLACRLCYQSGLHRQDQWEKRCSPYDIHVRQRLFWTVYFVDRRIALSCGRPYNMHDSHIHIGKPAELDDNQVIPDNPLPRPTPTSSPVPYLLCMCKFAQFAGEIFDKVFSGPDCKEDDPASIDFYINRWLEHELHLTLPTRSTEDPSPLSRRQEVTVRTRMQHLRLLLWRRKTVNLSFDPATGRLCGDLAIDIISRLSTHAEEIDQPSSFRYYLTALVGEAVLALAAILCQTSSRADLRDRYWTFAQSLRDGRAILSSLAAKLSTARQVSERLEAVMGVVDVLAQSDFETNDTVAADFQTGMNELLESQMRGPYFGTPASTWDGSHPGDFIFDNFGGFTDRLSTDMMSNFYSIDFM